MTPSTDSTSHGRRSQGRIQRHLDILAAARDATPEERRAILQAVRKDARGKRQTHPLPRWLASSSNRRALAFLAAAPFAAGVASAYTTPGSLPSSLIQLAGAAGLLAGIFLLRRASRQLTETSADDLDEREIQERNQALGTAYTALLGCLVVISLLAVADGPLLDTASWPPLIFGTFGTAVLLPSAAAAWNWREIDE